MGIPTTTTAVRAASSVLGRPKRGRKPDPALAASHKNQQLQRQIDRLRLAQAKEKWTARSPLGVSTD